MVSVDGFWGPNNEIQQTDAKLNPTFSTCFAVNRSAGIRLIDFKIFQATPPHFMEITQPDLNFKKCP